MKYSDVNLDDEFVGNMRQTSWSSLFPYWYMQDDFINAIGNEIELIKSEALFRLLNIGSKPPVLLWQNSLIHKEYKTEQTIKNLPDTIYIRAPIYKTWGQISFINRGDVIPQLTISFNETNNIIINEDIDTNDEVLLDITHQKFYINNEQINPYKNGEGLSYFITRRNNKTYQDGTPLHNEILGITFSSTNDIDNIELDATVVLENVVFENEQNIEITGLELIPIKEVILYAEYDFPYNKAYNGIKKVYVKKYDKGTNVVYDMITTHFYTKKFYVEVWFKGLDYPYTVGFPAYKDAELSSMYHINEKLNDTGEILGLPRREYKTNIPEEDYPFTFPEYYPFDIEQDYWYYKRLSDEYAWNDSAIDRVDVKDTEDNTVMRLHSINPFIEDFVVYTNSTYPQDIEGVNYNEYLPSFIYQEVEDNRNVQTAFKDVHHLLRKDDNFAYTTLYNKSDNFITYEGYKSKEMGLYFELSNLPENVNINGLEIVIDTESTDNSIEKYNDDRTRLQIADSKVLPVPIETSGHYELRRKDIIYGGKKELFGLERVQETNNYVEQKIVVGAFEAISGEPYKIPFEYYEDYDLDKTIDELGHEIVTDKFNQIDEDDIVIDDLEDAIVFFYRTNDEGQKECVGTSKAVYHSIIQDNKRKRYLYGEQYPYQEISSMNIISTEGNKHPFNIEIPVESKKVEDDTITAGKAQVFSSNVHSKYFEPKGYEGDLSYLLRNNGLYFIYALTNDSKINSSSVLIHNIFLRVYYSQKKEKISLDTAYHPIQSEDDRELGELYVKVENIGEKPYQTDVDIICPDNLALSQYHIPIDLDVGEISTTTIQVSYNKGTDMALIDGRYDIITICDDLERTNSVKVKTLGESYTSTDIESQTCFIDRDTTLTAYVTNIDGVPTNEGQVEFKINGYRIGEHEINVINGEASITFRPSSYGFIKSGVNDIEVVYSGSSRYNMSRGYASLWVNKNKTKISLDMPNVLVQRFENTAIIRVTYIDENGEDAPIQEGNVSLFLGDEEMFTAAIRDGIVENSFEPTYNTGNVIAKAVYSGTDTYPAAEVEKEIMVIGGQIKLVTPDINARPNQKITLKTYVYDMHDNEYPYGFIDYIIKKDDEIIYEYKNVVVYGGKAEHTYTIPRDAISLFDEDDEVEYDLIASYHSDIDGEIETDSYSHINIKREQVKIVHHFTNFNYSTKEPLGFYIEVLDKQTGYPVSDGTVIISIPSLGITIQENVDEEGKIKTIYSPLEYSAVQWNELLHSTFDFRNNEELYNSIDESLQAQYFKSNLYFVNDLYPEDEAPKLIDFKVDSDNELWFINKETEEMEYIPYLREFDDGLHVFIRTSDDEKREFDAGIHNMTIYYSSDYQYKKENLKTKISITEPSFNVDIPQYNVQYSDMNNPIIGYVTKYEEQEVVKDDNDEYISSDEENPLISEGNVNYYIDGNLLCCCDVSNSLAIIPSGSILEVASGKHLLMGEYFNNNINKTYTYSFLNVEKVLSTMTPDEYSPDLFNRVFPGKKSKLSVKISVESDLEITGHVNLYLNDTQIGYTYLTGEEDGHVLMDVEIPQNLEVLDYEYNIVYSGDSRINGCSLKGKLKATKLLVQISGDTGPIYATPQTECNLSFRVDTLEEKDDDDITQGKIAIIPFGYGENDYTNAKLVNVINNTANINITVPDEISETSYKYYLKYIEGINYEQQIPLELEIYVIEGYEKVIVDGTRRDNHVPNLKDAQWAVQNGGKIYISSWKIENESDLTKSSSLNNNFVFTKDVTITGDVIQEQEYDDEHYAKFVYPYIKIDTEILKNISTKVHSREDFTEEEFDELHLIDIEQSQININEFRLIDQELYYIQNDNTLMPVYLFDDGLYYAKEEIKFRDIVLNTNGHDITFENIRFKNHNLYNNFVIQNDGKLTIKHCIIENGVQIRSSNELICNENLIYGQVSASKTYDVDNNWWGQNTSPIPTNNDIILTIEAEQYPPVVGELIDIRLQLVGQNGTHYNLPQTSFKIYAETGNINISSGYLVNSQIVTSYDDATKESKVYGKVDNQIVSMDIYEYDKKTEVILEVPEVIPIGYQTTLEAIVQSVADKFYKFDKNNYITSGSNNISNGFATFYIDDKKVGRVRVEKGKATLPFYVASLYENQTLPLKVTYEPEKDYFPSKSKEINIKFINETQTEFTDDNQNTYYEHTIYVSPNALTNGNGTYGKPFGSINEALSNVQDEHTYKIYLKEGKYQNIDIDITNYKVELIKYNKDVTFTNIENTMAVINNNGHLKIKGINFVDNLADHLITNNNELNIEQCIFINNKTLVKNNSANTNITTSVIINNTNIVTDTNLINISECWFGAGSTNEPTKPQTLYGDFLQDYILMDLNASKSIIYIGSVAHIIASLDKRYRNGRIENYNGELPLRVALFSSTEGSLMPLKDYTYNNKSISLLNTTEPTNSDKIIITAEDNTNYYNDALKLKVFVENSSSNIAINNEEIEFKIIQKNKEVIPSQKVNVIDGIAELVTNRYKLNIGEYTLKCAYTKNDELYQAIFDFKVELPKLIVENENIDNGDHFYNLLFEADIISSIGENIDNLPIACYIDNVYIGRYFVYNNHLSLNLNYTPKNAGEHKLKIQTFNLNTYQQLNYEYTFTSREKITYIDFNETGLPQDTVKNLYAYIYDDNQQIVNEGVVTVSIDNKVIMDEYDRPKEFVVNNGKAIISIKNPLSNGQHSIVIKYSGVPKRYQSSIKVVNNFNVGLYPVKIGNLQDTTIRIEVGDTCSLNLLINDSFDKPVTTGVLYFDVDDICLNADDPAYIENGIVSCNLNTQRINIGTHDLTIRYIDESHIYADTNFALTLIVTQIETKILVESITATPNTKINVGYDISSTFSIATHGTLRAFLDGVEIGTEPVTASTHKQIQLSIPYIPIGDGREIEFKYHDNEGIFSDKTIFVPLSIKRGKVKMSNLYTAYYPKEVFNFDVEISDIENKPIDEGLVSVYVDGVLEHKDVQVHFGRINVPLIFNQVKEYNISVKYHQNNYYEETLYEQKINTNKIPITAININESLNSFAGATKTFTLSFTTIDNHNVNDGIVDFVFNGNTISSQYVQEQNKEFKLDIPIVRQGTYKLLLKYHDSNIFADKNDNVFNFIIDPEPISLTLNDIETELNNNITIEAILDKQSTDGIVEFYIAPKDDSPLGYNENNLQLIGIEQVNNKTNILCDYTVPLLYNENEFIILAEFKNSDKYSVASDICTLKIKEIDTSIAINNVNAYYQDEITITGTTNIKGNERIYIYIDEYNVGETICNNGDIEFKYRLSKKYKAGRYNIKAKYLGSKVIKAAESEPAVLEINKYTPTLLTHKYDVYIGNVLELDNKVLGNRNILLDEGILTKSINDEIIPDTIINIPTLMEPIITQDFVINVEFNPVIDDEHSDNEYNSFYEDVEVNMMKNPVTIRPYSVAPKPRGDTVTLHLSMTSDTTSLPVDLTAIINNEEVEIINGLGTYDYTLPMTTTDNNKFILPISIKENDVFIEKENSTSEFEISYINRSDIYIAEDGNDDYTGTEENPVATMQRALQLVATNGTIHLQKDINEDINIEQIVSINGYTDTVNSTINGNIEIKQKCNLSNLKFNDDNTNSYQIECEAEIDIDNCEFNNVPITFDNKFNINNSKLHDCKDSAITIQNKNKEGNIQNCEFYNNESINGAAIYASKGDNLNIEYCVFRNNNASGHGAALYLNGDTSFRYNTFYKNINSEDVYIIAGGIESEFNIFDNNNINIANYAGDVIANMTYWGYNDIENIDTTYETIGNDGNIVVESWLKSSYDISPQSSLNTLDTQTEYIITTFINKYRANREDQEDIEIMEPVDWKGEYTVYIDAAEYHLGNGISVRSGTGNVTITIGKEKFD